MKTTKQDFELFKKECDRWLVKLNLDDLEINYYHDDPWSDNADASVSVDYKYRRADIRFSVNRIPEDIKMLAKHEVLHLLVGEMKDLAQDRYVIQDEIVKADERLIRKLEKLL